MEQNRIIACAFKHPSLLMFPIHQHSYRKRSVNTLLQKSLHDNQRDIRKMGFIRASHTGNLCT